MRVKDPAKVRELQENREFLQQPQVSAGLILIKPSHVPGKAPAVFDFGKNVYVSN
jgi:hypothetical protein